jgi:hypothetical protein
MAGTQAASTVRASDLDRREAQMKLLALVGSLAAFVYFIGLLTLTFHNISKSMWALETGENRLVRFFMREIIILLWPLMMASEEGRHALHVIWTGKEEL